MAAAVAAKEAQYEDGGDEDVGFVALEGSGVEKEHAEPLEGGASPADGDKPESPKESVVRPPLLSVS